MCRVIGVRPVRDCLDGDFVREFELDTPLNESTMRRLAHEATLQFYRDFPRPYFRIDRRGMYVIQGVIGKTTFRVTFSRPGPSDVESIVICQVQKGEHDGC